VVKSQDSQDLAGTLSPHTDEHWSLLSMASLTDQWATVAEQAFNTLTVEQMMQNSLPKCIITVDEHTKTGKALQQMIDNSIDKVGVTDSDLDGRLVDVINLRNVRGLEGDNVLCPRSLKGK